MQLDDADLLAFHEFYGPYDSGPNANHFVFLNGDESMFSGGRADFNNNYLGFTNNDNIYYSEDLEDYVLTEYNVDFRPVFTIFFDFEKKTHGEPDIIFSNNLGASGGSYLSPGFFLGCSQNGDFFLHIVSSTGTMTKFFNEIVTANRSILVFSRDGASFTLSSYSPISGNMQSQSIVSPADLYVPLSAIKLGNTLSDAPFHFKTCNFTLYKFAIVGVGLPDFIISSLCKEIYVSTNSPRNSFLFKFLSVADKTSKSRLESVSGNNELNTGIILQFSPIAGGFSVPNDINLMPNSRFFQNGKLSSPIVSNNNIRFLNQEDSDVVVLDNFSTSVGLDLAFINFSGQVTGLFPVGRPCVYKADGDIRLTDSYYTLDSGNLCYNKKIVFEGNKTLTKI